MGKSMKKKASRRSTKRSTKRNRKNKLKLIGGGCGCNASSDKSTDPKPFFGGSSIAVNELNKFNQDPSVAPYAVSSRNLPDAPTFAGGKKQRKSKSKQRKSKRMKGGMSFFSGLTDPILGATTNSPITAFGTTAGALSTGDILNGRAGVNPAVYEQPIMKMYGAHNQPMV